MPRSLALAILVCSGMTLVSCATGVRPAPGPPQPRRMTQEECAQDVAPQGTLPPGFRVVDCRETSPSLATRSRPLACLLSWALDDQLIAVRFWVAETLNDEIRLVHRDGATRLLSPSPRTLVRPQGWGSSGQIACDRPTARLFYVHSALGYVVAFDAEGRELWRDELPGFVSVEDQAELRHARAEEALPEFDRSLSVAGTVTQPADSGLLLVEYRTGPREFRQAVYHRSGRRVAVIGPWDGFLASEADRGYGLGEWSFFAGGTKRNLDWSSPDRAVTVRRLGGGDPLERLFLHFAAWLTPRDGGPESVVEAARTNAPESVSSMLGDDFDALESERARDAVVGLGAGWVSDRFSRSVVAATVARPQPDNPSWIDRFHKGLLQAGADVDLARVAWPDAAPEPVSAP